MFGRLWRSIFKIKRRNRRQGETDSLPFSSMSDRERVNKNFYFSNVLLDLGMKIRIIDKAFVSFLHNPQLVFVCDIVGFITDLFKHL